MNDRIRQGIKNSKGSSLAFVLIISMVLMIMVASIMTVANSGFTFTQESVESRQAYIDAKSVIEFGKVEISYREKWLDVENNILADYYQQRADILLTENPDTTAINKSIEDKITKIKDHMTESYYITAEDKNNVSGTIKVGSVADALGVLSVTPPEVETGKTEYTFKIETQKLSRKLDYKCSFDYTKTLSKMPEIPNQLGTPGDKSNTWTLGQIIKVDIKKQPSTLNCNIAVIPIRSYPLNVDTLNVTETGHNIRITKFDWIAGKTLNLTADNVCFASLSDTATINIPVAGTTEMPGEIRFQVDYGQNNGQTNTLKAKNIIFEDDLEIGDNSTLNIDCENLWVAGTITLGQGSSLIINGIDGKGNQMNVHDIKSTGKKAEDPGCNLVINKFNYFSCVSLFLNNNSTLNLHSNIIKVTGNNEANGKGKDIKLSLDSLKSPIDITTQYLDVAGKTYIANLQGSLNINSIEDTLFIRFQGGYEQMGSTVNIGMVEHGADMVIFGEPDPNGKPGGGNDDGGHVEVGKTTQSILNVRTEKIYFDSDAIDVVANTKSQINYEGKRSDSKADVNTRSTIWDTGFNGNSDNKGEKLLLRGNYKATDFKGIIPKKLNYIDDYIKPDFSGSGGWSIDITNGTETYY